ncbi:hypothetical protein HNQ02_000209 [Flavobacterium sp. 7E]|uniref:DUF4907 domain-containing protein n=1 Tax=Flavobacterium sp. 7E TaxID=2735898 RepID=UPI0020C6C5F2|nr:DUF4907 domain-containing protein [Flavobacterium sp. 7E]NRS87309.1 hypothetical protein [Flavobacterium sp. 7E]
MMTINKNIKNFWYSSQKFFSLLNLLKISLVLLLIFLNTSCNRANNLKLESIKTTNGWGYTIKENDKIIIKQSIIPVIANNRSFETEEDALKVGAVVLQKLKDNTSPTLSKNDLTSLAIKI